MKTSPVRIIGARQNNLTGFDLDIPRNALVVVTGVSGSGKSSLAFDTVYAEGQRRAANQAVRGTGDAVAGNDALRSR